MPLLHLIREHAGIIAIVAIIALYWLVAGDVRWLATEGWEDSDGFHAGRDSASGRDDQPNHNCCNAADGSRNHG